MMRRHSLAEALPDFARPSPAAMPARQLRPQPAPAVPQTSDAEWQARLDRAVADAEGRMTAELQARHEQELGRLAEAHREDMRIASRDFAAAMGETIVARFNELQDRLVGLTSASAARLLSGVLSDDLTARSITRMEAVLRAALEDTEAVKVTVRGPSALYEPLRAALAGHADRVRFIDAPGADLSVQIDETVYETRLGEWSGALAEVLA